MAAKAVPALPEFPFALDYLWELFLEFSGGLVANGMGPVMASWNDVQQWCAAMLHDLDPWEKRTVIRLANLRAIVLSEKEPEKTPRNGK
jgi:hypothetical protein